MGGPSTDSACVSIVVINTHDDAESDGMEAAQEGVTNWVVPFTPCNLNGILRRIARAFQQWLSILTMTLYLIG